MIARPYDAILTPAGAKAMHHDTTAAGVWLVWFVLTDDPPFRPVCLSGTVYCHKPMRKSYSELGFRRGRSAPSAMACGRSKAYRPRKLMCLNRSGDTRATSASPMLEPSWVSWSMAAWM